MSGQDLFIHVDLVARKKWIEREKERENVEFPFKNGRDERNKGERKKGKRENQSVGAKFFPLNFFMTKK